MNRIALAAIGLVLLAPATARAEDDADLAPRPLRVTRRFQAGETWLGATAARVRIMPVDGAPLEQTIACTHSALVLDRPARFALRATLTSAVRRERAPGVLTRESWREGRAAPWGPAPPAWTSELDGTWGIWRVEGPDSPVAWLLAPFARDLGRPDLLPECLPGRLVDPRASLADAVIVDAWELVGAPVREVMLVLGRGGSIAPGDELVSRAREWWPAARIRYLGATPRAGRFRVVWHERDGHALTGSFEVDGAARLVAFSVRDEHAWGTGPWAVRAVREVEHVVLARVLPRAGGAP